MNRTSRLKKPSRVENPPGRACAVRLAVATLFVLLGSAIYAVEIGIDYNVKPNAARWVNIGLSGMFSGTLSRLFPAMPSELSFLEELRFGVSLDNGFYIPDFEENPGPTYRKPRSCETSADVRLTGMVSAFSFNVDWPILGDSIFGLNIFRYYAGPGLYFTGPAYFETGVRFVAGLSIEVIHNAGISSPVYSGDLYIEAAPRLGVELNSLWLAWDLEIGAGFRMQFGETE